LDTEKQFKTFDELAGYFKTASFEEYVKAREQSKRKMFLTPYSAQELREMNAKVFLSEDGVGFALKSDGDIIGVFNNSGRPGAGQEALIFAIASGGKTLDCIDNYLGDYYKRFGFVEKERVKWDDKQAPDGWEYGIGGRPDILFLEYPDDLGRDPVDVARRFELTRS
jgi:hypothetical protein